MNLLESTGIEDCEPIIRYSFKIVRYCASICFMVAVRGVIISVLSLKGRFGVPDVEEFDFVF